MKKSKTVLIVLCSVIAAAALIIGGIFIAEKTYFHDKRMTDAVETNFGLKLPDSAKLVYSQNDSGWFGDGDYCYVYDLKKEADQDFVKELSDSAERVTQTKVNSTLKKLGADSQINFENEIFCKKAVSEFEDDTYYMFYDPSELRIYAVSYLT